MPNHTLSYVNEAVSYLLDHDALVVLAPGLGLHGIILEFLREFHIQHGCHSGQSNAIAESSTSAPPKTSYVRPVPPRKGRLIGAPVGAESITHVVHTSADVGGGSSLRQTGSSTECLDRLENKRARLSSRLIILLNTAYEEGQVIRSRARLMGMVENAEDAQPQPKRRKIRDSSEEMDVPIEASKMPKQSNPFIEECPIQLSFYLPKPSESDVPEHRQTEYAKGGLFIMSSRILVTDLLCGRLPPEIVDGIIVNHADGSVSILDSD